MNSLVNRYGSIIYEPMNGICETSLYDLPTFDRMRKPIVDEINNVPNISVGNPMYLDSNKNDQIYQSVNKNNNMSIDNMSIDNPLYHVVPNLRH